LKAHTLKGLELNVKVTHNADQLFGSFRSQLNAIDFEEIDTMEKKIVVVVDAQNDFEDATGKLFVPGADKLIPLQNQFLAELTPDEIEAVVFTFDTHTLEDFEKSEEGQQFNFHCGKGTWGHKLAVFASLVKGIPLLKLEKDVFSMWAKDCVITALHPALLTFNTINRDTFFTEMLNKDVKTVEIIGVATDYCVFWAIQGFLKLGFKVVVRRDLVKGIAREIDQLVAEENLNIEVI
jgi:nicotinamidase/pyrazinamidase